MRESSGELSQLFSIGADFRMAPLALRERITVAADAAPDKLRHLIRHYASEAAIVSTCNRTEVFCLTDAPRQVADWLAGSGGDKLFQLRAKDAVRRAFSVASGLQSQIIGEPEITGQVKNAAQVARACGASGVLISRLMEKSLATAKVVRHQTDIGRHSLSYCGLVARAAAAIFPALSDVAILFVGAGDMTRSGLVVFSGRGVRRMTVASRNLSHAQKAAANYGDAVPLSALPALLGDYDIVISATASSLPVIGKGAVEHALRQRRHRPMVFADLGVPRDLEAEIAELPDVFVYTLQQLGELAEHSQRARTAAAAAANIIIEEHVDAFCEWWTTRQRVLQSGVLPSARHAPHETQRAIARLRHGDNPEEVVRDLSARLSQKITPQQTHDDDDTPADKNDDGKV